jgi:hypothetical protein
MENEATYLFICSNKSGETGRLNTKRIGIVRPISFTGTKEGHHKLAQKK